MEKEEEVALADTTPDEAEGGRDPSEIVPTSSSTGRVGPRLPHIFTLVKRNWNTEKLKAELPCTVQLGRGCDAEAPLSELMLASMPSVEPKKWNAFHLQSALDALEFREVLMDTLHRWRRCEGADWAVDPLLFLHGAEHLRVVRLEQNVAIEIIGNRLGFSPSRVAPGDLIWVYSLRLTHGFAMQALQKGIDLRNFTTLSYLEGVKSGNHPRTAFQVETFAHVTPHAAITCRLARVISTHKDLHVHRTTSLKVIVEGEMMIGRVDQATCKRLQGSSDVQVLRVFFRPPHPFIPHFSAPAKDTGALAEIAEILRKDREMITLMPERIGIMMSEAASSSTEAIVNWRRSLWSISFPELVGVQRQDDRDQNDSDVEMKSRETYPVPEMKDLDLGEDGWRDAVEVAKLGETGLRHEENRRLDKRLQSLTLLIVKRATTVVIGRIQFNLDSSSKYPLLGLDCEITKKKRETKQGWSDKGRRVKIRRSDFDDWTIGVIKRAERKDLKLTVWMVMDATSIKDFLEEQLVEAKLDCTPPCPLTNLMLGRPVSILSTSKGECILQTVYRLAGREPQPLPLVVSEMRYRPPTGHRKLIWTNEQLEIIARGPSLLFPILNVDAGAGTGKTTAIAGAIENTLREHGQGALIIATAVTNIAVETLVEKMLSVGSTRIKATRLHGKGFSAADLQQQLIDCAADDEAPPSLRSIGRELRCLETMMRALMQRQNDETKMDAESLDRSQYLTREMERKRDAELKNLLAYRKPNVIALTLDSLINAMTGDGPLNEYIEQGQNLFIWMDEASQTPELSIAALCSLLPNAYHRYVGDRRQLPSHQHRHYNEDPLDAALAGSVSMTLSRSSHTPTLRMRQCHRMHPALLRMVSSLFYENSLITSLSAEDRSLPVSVRLPDRAFPLCVICSDENKEEHAEAGMSMFNQDHECVAVALMRQVLIMSFGDDVAILSSYKEPVDRIQRSDPDIQITTVDSSMGAEYEAVVILTTRSSEGRLGFISDPRRVCVALTRGRRAIFIVGKTRVLRSAGKWTRFSMFLAALLLNVATCSKLRKPSSD